MFQFIWGLAKLAFLLALFYFLIRLDFHRNNRGSPASQNTVTSSATSLSGAVTLPRPVAGGRPLLRVLGILPNPCSYAVTLAGRPPL
jgi:hypothetical protein